ncbi:MAG: hypothetical protein AAGF56_11360 [Pseudomonadota bacterium]
MATAKLPVPGRPVSRAFFVYWTIGAMFIGMLIGPYLLPTSPNMQMVDHGGHAHHEGAGHHGEVDVSGPDAPSVAMDITRDPLSGWNMLVTVENFTFAPEQIAAPGAPDMGHGHVYLNGEKFARLYGPHFHLPDLVPGTHIVQVTLNTNDHDTLMVDGMPVAAETIITQPMMP